MMQLLNLFLNNGWDVAFASTAAESEYSSDLNYAGITKKSIELNSSTFDEYIKTLNPDVVIFDRFMTEEQFGWRVTENCPQALRILDTEDLHCLRKERERAWKKGRDFQPDDMLSSETAFREIASIYRCDLSLIISEYEMKLLNDLFDIKQERLAYTPFLFDPVDDDAFANLPKFEKRSDFVTIGNFLHEPNWNSILWLKEEIWPLIRKQLQGAKLHNYGAYPSNKVMQLHNDKEGFLIHGRADSAEHVIKQARVLLAPLRFGAGLKGKLTDAMQCGTPSVTTSVGAEGLNGEYRWPGFVADSADEIATAAVKLYQDSVIWHKAQQSGKVIINKRFSANLHGEELMRRIDAIRADLKYHRKRNFIGNMLTHHHHASTKFMGKWIEEKNRVK